MKTRSGTSNTAMLVLALGLLAGPGRAALGHDDAGEKVSPLMKQAVPEAAGRSVLMATVTFGPGQTSTPHLHPGSLFAYVLDGQVVSQLEGEAEKTYSTGDAWYEPPRIHHLVTRNPSKTKSARLLIWTLAKPDEPVKLPLPEPDAAAAGVKPQDRQRSATRK